MVASDSFRMSGVYWAATALALLDTPVASFRDEGALVSWIISCYKPEKGCFAPNTHHDGNLLATLSAVQLMALMGRTAELDADKIASCATLLQPAQPLTRAKSAATHEFSSYAYGPSCLHCFARHTNAQHHGMFADCASLQQPDGSFAGDEWGEIDTRFLYSALHAAALLHQLPKLDVAAAVEYVLRCQNFDGAFGLAPGCESHTGQVFCCVGALSIAGALDRLDCDRLGRWCASSCCLCCCDTMVPTSMWPTTSRNLCIIAVL